MSFDRSYTLTIRNHFEALDITFKCATYAELVTVMIGQFVLAGFDNIAQLDYQISACGQLLEDSTKLSDAQLNDRGSLWGLALANLNKWTSDDFYSERCDYSHIRAKRASF